MQLLRSFGLAARFVSGYLIQLLPDKPAPGEFEGIDRDFTDLHAWAEVFIPGAGWIGLDPTSGLLAAEGHIPLAATPEPESAAPVEGFTEPCQSELAFHMEVIRLDEKPRSTRPYPQSVWQQLTEIAKKLDGELATSDIRLSIGGEPTFISASDRESRQWHYDALGEEKYQVARQLLQRLFSVYAKGGIPLESQGKWSPGEPLPRWCLGCFWRRDGQPLWHASQLLFENSASAATVKDAESLLGEVADILGLPLSCIVTAFEDPIYYIHAESKLPPEFEKIIQGYSYPELERKRLLRVLDSGLEKPAGYALPLVYNPTHGVWESAELEFRRGFAALVPGDSPLGLRLPLDSITDAWQPEYWHDPFANPKHKVEPLPHRSRVRREPIRTFLCTEVRHGQLYVFLPPVNTLEEFCSLLAVVEKAVSRLGIPIRLEGYEPPRDNRLGFFRITPDPGVLEVNILPSTSLVEAIEKTRILYEEAEHCGLTAERYLIDGRVCGTGGGNHITLGALHPEDSPFLRRPEVLAALIAYWQNHPSLSYVFNGLFIGPTSQSPRIDEARDE
ncbi:MAG: transglutaminase family protein, partial [Turneriella sp.]|nr:transglutaminase family protein [Turneriella sp.]